MQTRTTTSTIVGENLSPVNTASSEPYFILSQRGFWLGED